ncbi:Aim36p [Kluyveromyces lactis]|uniref:Altered inheritance of mitochondria protein 36, mitochondrial n=1 Tax=Kluyveromyces lactis (strain ATCC 8585 / CBS 2359 / DSM 70799 / NBRC 1267 / NRRL Y-1140 / WM37) TaxID=284590 RepID=AIM36_KLULA|nr:uncharacterized protein KLLA0_E01431g [Kluyveromyces lactis]Q6CPX6.1 RecName: Full=Altered inheritance of mitochondria protein 36, mitochondrial; AltName: Full=Found in mitochondria protein 39; Flags: Precursor [Kluyveromyces lactis NRRL Y-1140]CAG99100.1 KLLA0E01431p [Kluyveromyces lactis]|eukprot:XP_454013.1 uncharacterized protein KLLA0_E01431g [Kluyveromyces lactis]
MFVRAAPRLLKSPVMRRMLSGKMDKAEEPPSFKTILLVGLVGTAIFVKAVDSLEQNKPKNTYTFSEFDTVMSGLRRRVSIFEQDDLNLRCVQTGVATKKLKFPEDAKVIKPSEAIEFFRNKSDDKYYVLLNDLYEKEGKSYMEKLPTGLSVVLIGKYMKEKCQKGDTVYLLDFPDNIKDAIKFENEVSVIDKVIVPNSEGDGQVSKYFKTVDKVETI